MKTIVVIIEREAALTELLKEVEDVGTLRIDVGPPTFDVGGPVLRVIVGRYVGAGSEWDVRLFVNASDIAAIVAEVAAAQVVHHRRQGHLQRWSAALPFGFVITIGGITAIERFGQRRRGNRKLDPNSLLRHVPHQVPLRLGPQQFGRVGISAGGAAVVAPAQALGLQLGISIAVPPSPSQTTATSARAGRRWSIGAVLTAVQFCWGFRTRLVHFWF